MVAESVSGWEKERLFSTDVIRIVMGLAEAVNFPTIPVKVTINEYVELSKFYGTPKSRAFVNGLLDRLVQKLVEDAQIVKEGKGLL
jgi:N utilization substance protein B